MTTAQQLERYTLLAVFLLALLSIVGLVALVAQGPAVPGVHVVYAESSQELYPDSNIVGGAKQAKTDEETRNNMIKS